MHNKRLTPAAATPTWTAGTA